MIRIHRPALAPQKLQTDGISRRSEHEADYSAHRAEIESGKRSLPFDRKVYADETVKSALVAMQQGKCAFCESKPLVTSDGDVEHFRPKAGARQAESDPLTRPGYYWLAYEWTNLLFSCERCNRRHKKGLFPLIDPARRARSSAELDDEAPVFVDPSSEDPTTHIGFREHVPIALSDRGEATIEALGLRRAGLNQDRQESLERLQALRIIADDEGRPEGERTRARTKVDASVAPDAKYSRMCQVALGSPPSLPDP